LKALIPQPLLPSLGEGEPEPKAKSLTPSPKLGRGLGRGLSVPAMLPLMTNNWFVDDRSTLHNWQNLPEFRPFDNADRPYRLHRLLTDLEDLLETVTEPQDQLQQMIPMVRCFLDSAPWLLFDPLQPDPETGWAVRTIYDEPFFPLTVQIVSWAPGMVSSIHNHASWGLVALLEGQEKNDLWERQADLLSPVADSLADQPTLEAGDIITFLPEAIHRVTALGHQPTISFNLYGETDYDRRFEFDPITHQATLF
jgi:predicted metal-dependent enzyme (double-stranded beta helix superfamily)